MEDYNLKEDDEEDISIYRMIWTKREDTANLMREQ